MVKRKLMIRGNLMDEHTVAGGKNAKLQGMPVSGVIDDYEANAQAEAEIECIGEDERI